MDLRQLSEEEKKGVLKFVEALADKETKNRTADFNFDEVDSETLAQATQQARDFVAHRKTSGGRMLVDDSEGQSIRASIRSWMKKTKRDKKYGIADDDD
jgi:hypothetical protein